MAYSIRLALDVRDVHDGPTPHSGCNCLATFDHVTHVLAINHRSPFACRMMCTIGSSMHEIIFFIFFRILRRHPSYSGRCDGGRLTMCRLDMFAQSVLRGQYIEGDTLFVKMQREMSTHDDKRRRTNPLSDVPRAPCPVDDLSGLPYKPDQPLPNKSFCMYIVGAPGSGKSNLWQSMLISKKPCYYRGFFDHIELVSGSLETLDVKVRRQLPATQQHHRIDDTVISRLVDNMQKGENHNNLLVLDDVIKGIGRSKVLSQIFLNRRHCTHNSGKRGHGGLALFVTSQKYNLLPLEFRSACDHVVLFKTSNAKERSAIKDELMQDLSSEEQDKILEEAWKEPHSFLFIKVNAPKDSKYYIRFDKV